MIRYSQQDPRWKNKQLGTGDCTIGSDGCLLTDFAMLTGVMPSTLNDQMVVHGGFSGSLIITGVVQSVYPALWIDSRIPCENNPAPIDTIDKVLASGKPVIVQVDTSPSPGVQSHWVILTGKVGTDYSMLDPWPLTDNPPATLLGRYGKGRKAEVVITYIIVIGGIPLDMAGSAVITPDTPDVALVNPPEKLDNVNVITDYINIRLQPNTNIPPIGRVTYGMDLKTCGDPVNGFYPVILWVNDGGGKYLE